MAAVVMLCIDVEKGRRWVYFFPQFPFLQRGAGSNPPITMTNGSTPQHAAIRDVVGFLPPFPLLIFSPSLLFLAPELSCLFRLLSPKSRAPHSFHICGWRALDLIYGLAIYRYDLSITILTSIWLDSAISSGLYSTLVEKQQAVKCISQPQAWLEVKSMTLIHQLKSKATVR